MRLTSTCEAWEPYSSRYILRSDSDPDCHYVGRTSNLDERLAWHNEGPCGYTKHHPPWSVVVSLEFPDESRAARFERYLKTPDRAERSRSGISARSKLSELVGALRRSSWQPPDVPAHPLQRAQTIAERVLFLTSQSRQPGKSPNEPDPLIQGNVSGLVSRGRRPVTDKRIRLERDESGVRRI